MTLREVRGVVCSFLHQMFIADPSLAKLVHFQVFILKLSSKSIVFYIIIIIFFRGILGSCYQLHV